MAGLFGEQALQDGPTEYSQILINLQYNIKWLHHLTKNCVDNNNLKVFRQLKKKSEKKIQGIGQITLWYLHLFCDM